MMPRCLNMMLLNSKEERTEFLLKMVAYWWGMAEVVRRISCTGGEEASAQRLQILKLVWQNIAEKKQEGEQAAICSSL